MTLSLVINSPLNAHLAPLFSFTFKLLPAADCPRSHSSISSCAHCLLTLSFSVFLLSRCCSSWETELLTRDSVEWCWSGSSCVVNSNYWVADGVGGWGCASAGNSLLSVWVWVCPALFQSCSSELFIVWYSGWGMRPVGSLEKCQRVSRCLVFCWCIHVMWQAVGHGVLLEVGQRGMGCVHLNVHSLFFSLTCYCVHPLNGFLHSQRQPQQKLNTESYTERVGGNKEREKWCVFMIMVIHSAVYV